MPFKGPYPTKFSGSTTAISVISGAFLSGGNIFDSGVIIGGIKVDASSRIVASGGTANTAITVANTATFGGGINNAGKLSAVFTGIFVSSVSVFTGGITNSGTISAGHSHDGIFVSNTSIFSGGIRNAASGRIAAGDSGIEVKLVSTFTGGISNAGTITSTGRVGIFVDNASLFSGDISNSSSGRIAAGSTGIEVKLVTTFAGASVTRARFSRALTAFSSKTLRSSPATSSIAASAELRPAPPASR
jgi:hypothetical protein